MVRREGEVESAVSCAPLYGLSISVDEGGGDGADVVGLEGLGGDARGAVQRPPRRENKQSIGNKQGMKQGGAPPSCLVRTQQPACDAVRIREVVRVC